MLEGTKGVVDYLPLATKDRWISIRLDSMYLNLSVLVDFALDKASLEH